MSTKANKPKALVFPRGCVSLEYKDKNFKLKKMHRVAIFASFSGNGEIADYVVYYLKQLKKVCDAIVFIADNPILPQEIEKIKELVIYAKFERHTEYDFGSYKRGYQYIKKAGILGKCDEVVICNDSVYGPFEPLTKMFETMSKKTADFWGMIESKDTRAHLQSWFLVFKKTVIDSGYLGKFLSAVTHQETFMDVVQKYELRLTRYLSDHDLTYSSYIAPDKYLKNEQNINGNMNIVQYFPYYCLKNKLSPFIKIKSLLVGDDSKCYLHEDPRIVIEYVRKTNREMYEHIKRHLYARDRKTYEYLFEEEDTDDLIAKAKVVSFDCFDTLLTRPYVVPTDLFVHMERFYDIPGFAEQRINAEKRARKQSDNPEVSLQEIYAQMLPKFQKYKRNELLFEETVLKRVNKNYLLYQTALKKNKPVIVISDMYLPAEFIKSVLAKNGYDKIAKVYVSNDLNMTKGSGDLYRRVLADFDLKPGDLLHIGDNRTADIEIPNAMGIKTFLSPSVLDEYVNYYGLCKYYQTFSNLPCLESSVLLSLITKYSIAHNLTYWQHIGYAMAAPFIFGYLAKIEEEVKNNKIDTLLFVARDGYLLQKYYNILSAKPVENHYIYAPRVLNLKCFGDWCNESVYLQKYANILSKHIKQFDGVHSDRDIKKALDFYQDKIQPLLAANKASYMKYLKRQNIKGKRIASVDMTTGAFTSERFLLNILKDRYCLGFFSATFKDKSDLYKYITFKNAVINPADSRFMEFLELLITSPEPPIADVIDGQVKYKDICNYDKQRMEILKDIDFGVEKFIEDIQRVFTAKTGANLFSCMKFSMEFIMHEINMLCVYMSAYDVYKLKCVMHSGDILNEDYVSLYDELVGPNQ